ncbi:hypothetical protein P4S95_10295 [Aneurinibacillus aneurinilyticus]|uniref:hypothetical protein n=1 Tax=Aneurinibacillus aneurinilyticus TaxID=1391 RepID=UPI002E1E4DFB|nr:hypothetical protein [Aneurinibacillus aneurinilyticus]
MNEQLERLKEIAEWHESKADDLRCLDESHAIGQYEYHTFQAKKYWYRYGWLLGEIETMKEFGEEMILLPGRALR